MQSRPFRVGILNDLADAPPGPATIQPWLQLAVDELRAQERLDREVEFVHAWGLGLPNGTAAAVERAYAELAAQDCLLVVGPAIGDNALVATPLAERHGLPTLNWAGAERGRGDFMFQLQVGSHEDESILLARHLATRGGRIGVVYDRSPIGRRHLDFFQQEAEILRLDVAALQSVSPLADDAGGTVSRLLATAVDSVLYLGLGVAVPAVAAALRAAGWSGHCAMNTAGLRGYAPEFARQVDGWVYVDMHADDNRTLQSLCERQQVPRPRALAAAKGYDLGRLVAEALARAPELTRRGVREGFERTKWLPAAEGEEGTLLGFGVHDRGALHGRYLVLRQWRDGATLALA